MTGRRQLNNFEPEPFLTNGIMGTQNYIIGPKMVTVVARARNEIRQHIQITYISLSLSLSCSISICFSCWISLYAQLNWNWNCVLRFLWGPRLDCTHCVWGSNGKKGLGIGECGEGGGAHCSNYSARWLSLIKRQRRSRSWSRSRRQWRRHTASRNDNDDDDDIG